MGQFHINASIDAVEAKSCSSVDHDVARIDVIAKVMRRNAGQSRYRNNVFGRQLLGLIDPSPDRRLRDAQRIGHSLFAGERVAGCHQGFVSGHAADIRLRIIHVNTQTYGDLLFVYE